MLLVMSAHQNKEKLCVEELKTKLFSTSRPKSSMMINEACDRGFIHLEKTEHDKRRKTVKPSTELIKEFKPGKILPSKNEESTLLKFKQEFEKLIK